MSIKLRTFVISVDLLSELNIRIIPITLHGQKNCLATTLLSGGQEVISQEYYRLPLGATDYLLALAPGFG